MKRIPKFVKSFYFLFTIGFIAWMLFLDSNDLISQLKLNYKKQALEDERAYYEAKIEEVKKDREELMSDPALLEKFAREKYFMKKKSEDLYVIVEE